MSKCRAKNPQKCYYHSAMGRFVFRLAKVKTQASDEQIKKTMSELNKEGKNLPAPNQQDVANWIDGRELATQFDPDLDKKEREIQMNYLKQAREDVTEGVSGARFHMWKNLVGRLKKNVGRKVAALAIGGALIVGLGACSSNGGGNAPTDQPSSSSSASSQPSDGATASTGKYGDVVGLKAVTDKYGKYEQTTISPNAKAMKLDKSVVDSGASQQWSDAELQSAQQFVVKFVTEETVDSTALDNRDAWTQWQKDNKHYFSDANYDSIVVQPDASGTDRSLVINNDFIMKGSTTPYNPIFVRDGKPRVSDEQVKVTSIKGGVDVNGNKYADVYVTSKVTYRVSSKNALDYLNSLGQGNIASDKLKSGKGEVTFIMDVNSIYEVIKQGDDWKISGDKNSFNGYAGEGWANVPVAPKTNGN